MKRLFNSASAILLLLSLFINIQPARAQAKLDLDWFFEELENSLPCPNNSKSCTRYKNLDWNLFEGSINYQYNLGADMHYAFQSFKSEEAKDKFLKGLETYQTDYQLEKIHTVSDKVIFVVKKGSKITGYLKLYKGYSSWSLNAFTPYTKEEMNQIISQMATWSNDNFEPLKDFEIGEEENGQRIFKAKIAYQLKGMIESYVINNQFDNYQSVYINSELPVYFPAALRHHFKVIRPYIPGFNFEEAQEEDDLLKLIYTKDKNMFVLRLSTIEGKGKVSSMSFQKAYDIKQPGSQNEAEQPAEEKPKKQPKTQPEPAKASEDASSKLTRRVIDFAKGQGFKYGPGYIGETISENAGGRTEFSWQELIGKLSEDGKTVYLAHGEGTFTHYVKGVSYGMKTVLSKSYTGSFRKGKMHGKGQLHTQDEDYEIKEDITGTWVDGKLHGDNIQIEDHEKRTISTGSMKNGKRTGTWTIENKKTGKTTTINY